MLFEKIAQVVLAGQRKNTSLTCHRKCLTVSEGNIVCQFCVCVCVCYLCISFEGLPVEVPLSSNGRGMLVCYTHQGPCNPRLEMYLEQVHRGPGPQPHQHNIPPSDRTNYTAPPLTHLPKNKLALPLNQTVVSAYTLSAMLLLLRETDRGKRGADYSFGPICFHLP